MQTVQDAQPYASIRPPSNLSPCALSLPRPSCHCNCHSWQKWGGPQPAGTRSKGVILTPGAFKSIQHYGQRVPLATPPCTPTATPHIQPPTCILPCNMQHGTADHNSELPSYARPEILSPATMPHTGREVLSKIDITPYGAKRSVEYPNEV